MYLHVVCVCVYIYIRRERERVCVYIHIYVHIYIACNILIVILIMIVCHKQKARMHRFWHHCPIVIVLGWLIVHYELIASTKMTPVLCEAMFLYFVVGAITFCCFKVQSTCAPQSMQTYVEAVSTTVFPAIYSQLTLRTPDFSQQTMSWNHSSNTTCLTQVFFKSGEQCSNFM